MLLFGMNLITPEELKMTRADREKNVPTTTKFTACLSVVHSHKSCCKSCAEAKAFIDTSPCDNLPKIRI